MNCPNCKTELRMSERHSVEIDYCPSCRGVWLDRGELDKIIEQAGALYPAAPAVARAAPYRDEAAAPDSRYTSTQRKKRSLLGEIFDFD